MTEIAKESTLNKDTKDKAQAKMPINFRFTKGSPFEGFEFQVKDDLTLRISYSIESAERLTHYSASIKDLVSHDRVGLLGLDIYDPIFSSIESKLSYAFSQEGISLKYSNDPRRQPKYNLKEEFSEKFKKSGELILFDNIQTIGVSLNLERFISFFRKNGATEFTPEPIVIFKSPEPTVAKKETDKTGSTPSPQTPPLEQKEKPTSPKEDPYFYYELNQHPYEGLQFQLTLSGSNCKVSYNLELAKKYNGASIENALKIAGSSEEMFNTLHFITKQLKPLGIKITYPFQGNSDDQKNLLDRFIKTGELILYDNVKINDIGKFLGFCREQNAIQYKPCPEITPPSTSFPPSATSGKETPKPDDKFRAGSATAASVVGQFKKPPNEVPQEKTLIWLNDHVYMNILHDSKKIAVTFRTLNPEGLNFLPLAKGDAYERHYELNSSLELFKLFEQVKSHIPSEKTASTLNKIFAELQPIIEGEQATVRDLTLMH
jgi:hypothetical protein